MKYKLTTILLILVGILLFAITLYFSEKFWFSFDINNGSEVPALMTVIIGSGLSFALILHNLVAKINVRRIILLLCAVVTTILFVEYQKNLKHYRLENEGQETYAVVTFSEFVKYGKSSGHEIRYDYTVNNKAYRKSASNEDYILDNEIELGDSLIIRYWINNPNCHIYKVDK